jgi:hypothetical protein
VTLFEAATGRLPFDERWSAGEKHPTRPAHAPRMSELVPDVPRTLDDLVAALLDPNPRRRPGEADVLRALSSKTPRRPSHSIAAGVEDGEGREETELARAFHSLEAGPKVVRLFERPPGDALAARFADEAESVGALVLRGRCRPNESMDMNGLDEVVDELSHALEHMSYVDLVRVLPPHVAALPNLFPVLGRLEAPTDGALARCHDKGPETAVRARRALKDLLRALGHLRRVVIWIDDFEHADAASRELLNELLQPPDAPAMLVVLACQRDDVASICA